MPSQWHEALLELFRHRPPLAPELLHEVHGVDFPSYSEIRVESADLSAFPPVEYRADLVLLLYDGRPVYGIIVEVQLRRDARKPFVWPTYATLLRSRIQCPVSLLVVTQRPSVARWAATPIDIGGGNSFTPYVLGPDGVPIVDDIEQAWADPELAVLSAMAHGRDRDSDRALRIAVAAMTATLQLDPDRSRLYGDLVAASLGAAARRELQAMDPSKYVYKSEFAKHYIALGRNEGRTEGEARGEAKGKLELTTRLLSRRFGRLSAAVRARLAAASPDQLDRIAERLLDAATLDEVFTDR